MASDWTEATLGNLCDFLAGSAFPKKYQGEAKGDYPFIKVSDMNLSGNERHIIDANNWVSESTRAKIGAKLHPKGSIAFAKIGVALTYNRRRILNQPTILDNNMMSAIPNTDVVNPIYFYYLLTTIDFNDVVCGTSLPYLRAGDLKKFQLQLPPDPDQRAIAHILGSLDDKIELNRRMNQTLEAMVRAIFKSWFVDFEPVRAKAEGRPTGLPEEIAALFPDSFEDSEVGEIPTGWEVSTIGENAEKLSKGTTPRKNDVLNAQDTPSIPFLKVRNISDEGEIDLSKLDRIPRSIHEGFLKRSILKTDDVLFSIAGTIGRVSILHEELNDSNANQAIAFVRPKKNELPSTFIRLILISDRIQYEASSRVVQGVQANVSLTVLSELKFAKPPQSIIDIWLRYFGDSFSRQELLLRESRSLSALRDTLLPKLISGDLRVPDAEKFVEEAGI